MPALPAPPALNPGVSGDLVTITVAEAVEIARYIERVGEVASALNGCPTLTWEKSKAFVGYEKTDEVTSRASRAIDLDGLAPLITPDGVEVEVSWEKCGAINAYYSPLTRDITMCYELAGNPAAARFAFAHEMGHAVIDQLDLPITGSEEDAADEYAALLLSVSDHREDVLAAAVWFLQDGVNDAGPSDVHSGNAHRAYTIACLEDGSEDEPANYVCAYRFHKAVRAWVRLLGIDAE